MQTPCDEGCIGKGGWVVCDNPDIFDFEMMCFACILGDYSCTAMTQTFPKVRPAHQCKTQKNQHEARKMNHTTQLNACTCTLSNPMSSLHVNLHPPKKQEKKQGKQQKTRTKNTKKQGKKGPKKNKEKKTRKGRTGSNCDILPRKSQCPSHF